MEQIEIDTVSGQSISPWLDDIAQLRLKVFKEFPYLYEGSLDYEAEYLRRYADSKNCVFVLAKVNRNVVGVATGLPLQEADEAFQKPFIDQRLPVEQYFYFGESVLDKAFRGRGIGHIFFDAREAFAWQLGLQVTTFCAVQRPLEHPLRPLDYRPLDGFWEARGYRKREDLIAHYSWQDINETNESLKSMVFWIKSPAKS